MPSGKSTNCRLPPCIHQLFYSYKTWRSKPAALTCVKYESTCMDGMCSAGTF